MTYTGILKETIVTTAKGMFLILITFLIVFLAICLSDGNCTLVIG